MRMKADVIAQHTTKNEIIPLKIRIQDEGGSYQTYSVKGYKRVNAVGKVTLPNEVTVSSHIKYFQCKLNLFGKEKIIGLSYNFYQQEWYVDF